MNWIEKLKVSILYSRMNNKGTVTDVSAVKNVKIINLIEYAVGILLRHYIICIYQTSNT